MKSASTAGLLALFLGGIGIHKFYLNRPFQGLLYMIFCWTFVPAIVGVIEGISYFSYKSDEDFNMEFGFIRNPDGSLIKGKYISGKLGKTFDSQTRKCDLCQEDIQLKAIKCKHCGANYRKKYYDTETGREVMELDQR